MTGSPSAELVPPAVVGFVGLGQMGKPMSERLLQAGYVVKGYDVDTRTRQHIESAGGQAVERVAEVAEGADAVILMLPTSEVVASVLLDDGLLEAMTEGTLLIDMSSSRPEETTKLADRARQAGIAFVDAPVSGGVRGARAGTLTIMCGGDRADVARCHALLEAMGKSVVHAGAAGAGHALKALNNLLSASHFLATSEAISTGRRFGLDPQVMLDAINGSSGKNWSSEMKFPTYVLPEQYNSGFALRLLVKDTQIAVDLARHVGQPASHAEATLAAWKRAADDLAPDADHTEIARWVDSLGSR